MHNKEGLQWNTSSCGFFTDRSNQNGSLSRMESEIFVFTGKKLNHCRYCGLCCSFFLTSCYNLSVLFETFRRLIQLKFNDSLRRSSSSKKRTKLNKALTQWLHIHKHLFPAHSDLRFIFSWNYSGIEQV